MLKASLGSYPESGQVLLGDIKKQAGVKKYGRLPDYDDFQRSDLPSEMELSVISQRIPAWAPMPSRIRLKHHLINMHIPKKLFKSIRENAPGVRKMNSRKKDYSEEWL